MRLENNQIILGETRNGSTESIEVIAIRQATGRSIDEIGRVGQAAGKSLCRAADCALEVITEEDLTRAELRVNCENCEAGGQCAVATNSAIEKMASLFNQATEVHEQATLVALDINEVAQKEADQILEVAAETADIARENIFRPLRESIDQAVSETLA